jgi:hypothetical protein
MNYQNGWIYRDDATEAQIDAANEPRLDKLAEEAATLFREIPEPSRRFSFAISKSIWQRIEVIEELLRDRGARFVRNNERYNEDEGRRDLLD